MACFRVSSWRGESTRTAPPKGEELSNPQSKARHRKIAPPSLPRSLARGRLSADGYSGVILGLLRSRRPLLDCYSLELIHSFHSLLSSFFFSLSLSLHSCFFQSVFSSSLHQCVCVFLWSWLVTARSNLVSQVSSQPLIFISTLVTIVQVDVNKF